MAILPPDKSEFAQNGDLMLFLGGEIYSLDTPALTSLRK